MKTVFNIVLGLCAVVLIYICYASIADVDQYHCTQA